MTERLFLFDTTLRDGAQTRGVDFSLADKVAIAEALDRLGLEYIEGGWPGANPTDDAFFTSPPALHRAKLVGFGMTRRPGRSVDNDPGLAQLVNSGADAICLVGKSWDFHVKVALDISEEENLAMIAESIAHCKARKGEAMFDAEHFFDGYQANPAYALACARAAYDAGARWIVLCDTNGGTLPDHIAEIVKAVATHIPSTHLGIHAHNDTENAVANSLAAVNAGVRQVQGTLNGLGERCGNANMCALIPSLKLKTNFNIGVEMAQLSQVTAVSRLLDDRLNRPPQSHQAYVGDNAFAHKGGLHVSAVTKDPRTYEHIPPEMVGNRRHIIVSDQSGRANIVARLAEAGMKEIDDDKLQKLLKIVKDKEFSGFSYDGAEASFELLARHTMGQVPTYFDVTRFRVMDECRFNAMGQRITESEATVHVKLDQRLEMRVAMGNGPVNALDTALRQALLTLYPILADMSLTDYRVRILPPRSESTGTDAITRVMIESRNSAGLRWTTVGASANIIDASFIALRDAYIYKLFHHAKESTSQ